MNTPVADFVRAYAGSGVSRLHMPGHKGQPFLGCEALDITEVQGADALFEAEGILRESEEHAASLFGAARTLYSTEGSSLCIRAHAVFGPHLPPCRDGPADPGGPGMCTGALSTPLPC